MGGGLCVKVSLKGLFVSAQLKADLSALQKPALPDHRSASCLLSFASPLISKPQNESCYLIKAVLLHVDVLLHRSDGQTSTKLLPPSLRLRRKRTSTAAALDNTAMNSTPEFQLNAVHWEMQTEFLWQPCTTLKPLAREFVCWSLTGNFINIISVQLFTFSTV